MQFRTRALLAAAVMVPLAVGLPAVALAGDYGGNGSDGHGGPASCHAEGHAGDVHQGQRSTGSGSSSLVQSLEQTVGQTLDQSQDNDTDQDNDSTAPVTQMNPVVAPPALIPGTEAAEVHQDNRVDSRTEQGNANRTEQDQSACQSAAG